VYGREERRSPATSPGTRSRITRASRSGRRAGAGRADSTESGGILPVVVRNSRRIPCGGDRCRRHGCTLEFIRVLWINAAALPRLGPCSSRGCPPSPGTPPPPSPARRGELGPVVARFSVPAGSFLPYLHHHLLHSRRPPPSPLPRRARGNYPCSMRKGICKLLEGSFFAAVLFSLLLSTQEFAYGDPISG
jgi:hypothetical protein